jgi:EAL and modified HD-GYP domain-containing signal transduction protein
MAATSNPPHTPETPRINEIFLARQPILDRAQQLFAYELLFRGAAFGPADITTDLSATASVILHASQFGMEKVIGDALGFVNVDAAVLMSDIFKFLPRERIVLEIVETMKVTPEIYARVAELVQKGFRFALDDVIADTDEVKALLPLIEFVKLDLRDMPLSALLKLAPQFKLANKKLLAEKVESQEEFQVCLDLGFDYFQGYYFAKPHIMSGRKLSPSQHAVLRLMTMLTSDADSAEVERVIKSNVSLGLNLLRLVNTPTIGYRHRIDSLSQALIVLGRRQLQRWLQIILYAEPVKDGQCMSPLLQLATTRGRLLELLAEKLRPGHRAIADQAFTVGIMSLMDVLFAAPMDEILGQVPVVEEVSNALLHHTGFCGELLQLAQALERIKDEAEKLPSMLDKLTLSHADLLEIEVAAFEWSDNISRSVQ